MSEKRTCKHGYLKFHCSECPPLPLAAEIMQELINATEALENVRGHSSRCGATCYCGALSDKEKAEGRLSWATTNAYDWCRSYKQKEIKSIHHDF